MTYGGEQMTRRDKGQWPPRRRSEAQMALRELGSVVLAALAVCGLVLAWHTARAYGVIT